MSNELANININSLTVEQLSALNMQIVAKIVQEANMNAAEALQLSKANQIELEQAKLEHKKQLEMEIARHRVTESKFGFVSLTDLGLKFQVSIGPKVFGKLLRVVGICHPKSKQTIPFRKMIDEGFAETDDRYDVHGKMNYRYNPEKCIKKIDRWLTDHGRLDEFYSATNEKERAEFIGWLYQQYVGEDE